MEDGDRALVPALERRQRVAVRAAEIIAAAASTAAASIMPQRPDLIAGKARRWRWVADGRSGSEEPGQTADGRLLSRRRSRRPRIHLIVRRRRARIRRRADAARRASVERDRRDGHPINPSKTLILRSSTDPQFPNPNQHLYTHTA